MTEIIISEKPSAALKLATALADTKPVAKKVGRVTYYELKHKGKDIVVVCAVGHLYTVTEKEKKGMRYPVFDIKWDEAATVKKEAAFTKQYLDVIKKLAKDADIFTVACDYDIEGEVIGWNVIRFACNKKDAKRMKFSTLTKDELVSSYEKASKHLDWGQAKAGETRHLLDWVWGLNLSRALTLSIKNSTGMFKLMSAGRVQGPALKILADKEREIKKFKAEPYWEIELTALKDKTEVKALHKEDKFWDKKKAERVIKNTKGKKAKVDKVTKKEIIQKAPNPFDLTTLQTEAYRVLRISPKETLAIAQDLYIKAYISYPRTSSQILPESINYKKILTNLSKIKDYKELCEELLKQKKLKPNNGKKTDPAHPAVHPTGIIPKGLNERAKKVYSLIVRRFMASFAPDAKRESVNVEIDINKEIFIARGIRTKEAGWYKWYGRFLRLKEKELPKLEKGEELKVKSIDMHDKETQPPKRYTPASIIKELSNREIGTKATRAAIIDNLYKRNYVAETSMEVTNLGMKTVETLEKYSPDILDEELTRKFEEDMEKIRENKSKPEEVMKKAEKVLTKILKDFKEKENDIGKKLSEANVETRDLESELGSCLKCKDGTLRIMYSRKVKSYFVGCSNHPKCDAVYSLPKGALIRPAKKECEHCKLPKVLVIRKGRKPQELCINPDCSEKKKEERKIKKDLKEVEDRIKDKKCPECKEGSLVLRKSFYGFFIGCSNYPKCRHTENIKKNENKS